MKISFFSENGHTGKIPRNFANMRTEFAWQCALDADHHRISIANKLDYDLPHYDLGIVIPPKHNQFNIEKIRVNCNKLAFMQEGPCWLWEDFEVQEQIKYLNYLDQCDFLLCHNFNDANYFYGLTGKNTYHIRSLMIEDALRETSYIKEERKNCIIPGNMCAWYGGATSTIIAKELDCKIYTASMGRKKEDETLYYEVEQLPYVNWSYWQNFLKYFKYMVSLMPTYAAGTAPLNAAYWGIPCIGYEYLDTMQLCHDLLCVEERDLNKARELARDLKTRPEFYDLCSKKAKENYERYFSEKVWLERWSEICKMENLC